MSLTAVTQLLQSGQAVVDSAIDALEATRQTQTRIEEAMDFTDRKIAEHNSSNTAHTDIREELVFTEEVIMTPITSGATIRTPEYEVNSHRLCVFIDGVKCLKGEVYNEIGNPGEKSNTITFLTDISDEYDVSVSC